MIKFLLENMFECFDEFAPLTKETWDEVDQLKVILKYDPDWETYRALDEAGAVRLYTVRDDDGVMVGYAIYLVQPMLHCKGQLHALSDVMYIRKEHRGSGKQFLEAIQEDLKNDGVKLFTFTVKSWADTGALAESVGCKLFEKVYQKGL